MVERGSMFGAEHDENMLAKQAEIMAMRQIADTLRAVQQELKDGRDSREKLGQTMAEIQRDIAVMKEQNKAFEIIRNAADRLDARVKILETRQQQIDGAQNLVKWLREFGPWIVSLVVLAWGLFQRAPR